MASATNDRSVFTDAPYAAPQSRTEQVLAEVFSDVLQVFPIGRTDSFFDFGGTSLQAVRICARLRERIRTPVRPEAILDAETLASLATSIETADPEVTARPDGEQPEAEP
jgi:acyl carrier protein